MNALDSLKRLANLDIPATIHGPLTAGANLIPEQALLFEIRHTLLLKREDAELEILETFFTPLLTASQQWAQVWLQQFPSTEDLIRVDALNREAQERFHQFQSTWHATQNVHQAYQAAMVHYCFEPTHLATQDEYTRWGDQLKADHQRFWRQNDPRAYAAFSEIQEHLKPLLKVLWEEKPVCASRLSSLLAGNQALTKKRSKCIGTKISKLNDQLEKAWNLGRIRPIKLVADLSETHYQLTISPREKIGPLQGDHSLD
jgi:hypothetical protein